MAERIERLALEVPVRAVLHAVILEGGELFVCLIEGDGQPAAGVPGAEQHVGDRIAAALTRGTTPSGSRARLACAQSTAMRGAGRQHEHDRLARRAAAPRDSLLLALRQSQVGAIATCEARIADASSPRLRRPR